MNRRGMLIALAGIASCGVAATAKPAQKLRIIRRWEGEDGWQVVRLIEIKKGDLFMLDDVKHQWLAERDAMHKDGHTSVAAKSLRVQVDSPA